MSAVFTMSAPCPLCPRKRTSNAAARYVRLVPKPVVSNRSKTCASFDHLIGAGEQRRRHGKAERLGCGEVDDEVEFGGLLDRDVARLRAA
jgi:hypothetical protein